MRPVFPGICISVILLLLCACDGDDTSKNLEGIIHACKNTGRHPSLAGAVYHKGTIQRYATGVKKEGQSDTVNENSAYHIGSMTKAMTATMIATIVEDGLLSWNSSILSVFPEMQGHIPSKFGTVTLTQLLTHRGGIAPFTELEHFLSVPEFSGTITEQRVSFSEWVIDQSDSSKIGKYEYSNAGYVIAASMAEKVTGQSWETLMTNRLFHPLEITDFYFDWPAENGRDEPWGHTYENNRFIPFNPDSALQFPVIFNPAGNLSLNLENYMKFVKAHIDGVEGLCPLLSKETFKLLHRAPAGTYAFGWETGIHSGNGQPYLIHDGSDGTFYSIVIILPNWKKAGVVLTNCYSDPASEAVVYAAAEMINEL